MIAAKLAFPGLAMAIAALSAATSTYRTAVRTVYIPFATVRQGTPHFSSSAPLPTENRWLALPYACRLRCCIALQQIIDGPGQIVSSRVHAGRCGGPADRHQDVAQRQKDGREQADVADDGGGPDAVRVQEVVRCPPAGIVEHQ